MTPDTRSLPEEASCEVSQEHLGIAERMARKYRNMQPDSHLHDDIDSASLFGLAKAYNYYDAANLTDALITTCVKNAILNTLRKKVNATLLTIEPETAENTRADAWEEALGTDEIVDLKRQSELLTKLLDGPLLNNTQRQIIKLMRSEAEYDQYEIAEMVGVQQPAVFKSANSAIEKLRATVSDELPLAS